MIGPSVETSPLLVAAVALVDTTCRVLVQQRAPGETLGGLWEFPGGKIEPGETAQGAAVREIAEELGVTLSPDDLVPVAFASGAHASGRALILLLFACRWWHGTPACLDAAAMAWHPPSALASLAMPPLDVPLAAALVAALGGGFAGPL